MGSAVCIALCGNAQIDDGDIEAIITECAHDVGFIDVDVEVCESPIDVIENIVRPTGAHLYDLLICGIDMQGMSAFHVFSDISEAEYVPPMIAFSSDSSTAYESLEAGIAEFLVHPVKADEFTAVVARQLAAIAAASDGYIVVRESGATRKINLGRIVHIETSGHDQVIHLIDGQTAKTRKTSNDMYELVSHDERFFKVGSSNIINLDRLACTREGNKDIHMEDGSVIVAPVRIRKTLEDALLSRAVK